MNAIGNPIGALEQPDDVPTGIGVLTKILHGDGLALQELVPARTHVDCIGAEPMRSPGILGAPDIESVVVAGPGVAMDPRVPQNVTRI